MDAVHTRLTSPTQQQQIEDAFSLTPAQYASLTHSEYTANYETSAPASRPPRRSLAEAIMAEHAQHASPSPPEQHKSKAEVYTRSLLWDQIPQNVVKQFRELVRDSEELEAAKQKQSYGYKVET